MNIVRVIIIFLGIMAGGLPSGQTQSKYLGRQQSLTFLHNGVIFGGAAISPIHQKEFSLLNIRRNVSKKSLMERIVLDMADSAGSPLFHSLGYYHVAVETKALRRMSIDLYQMKLPKMTTQEIRQIFKKSLFVKNVTLFYDEMEASINLTYELKDPTEVEVFELVSKGSPSRIVFDLRRIRE